MSDPAELVEANDRSSLLEHLAGKIAGLRPEWWSSASCLGADMRVFFPRLGATPQPAKLICSGCLVVSECREHALAHPDLDGVRGGMSHRERKNLETDRKRRESMR